jgi:hypothetical protein
MYSLGPVTARFVASLDRSESVALPVAIADASARALRFFGRCLVLGIAPLQRIVAI